MTYPLVVVDWVDITKHTTGWIAPEDAIEQAQFMQCSSMGYMLQKTKDKVVLVQTVCNNGSEMVADPLVIPNKLVTKIRRLK